jgi:uncharacterized membrane protein YidH (DUF202 family)
MTVLALAFSLLIFTLGAVGLVSPSRVVRVARYFATPAGFYFAAAVRVVMGLALLFAAPASRAPGILRILGVVIIVAGVITFFVGLERFRRLIDWWSAKGPTLARAQAAFAVALGLLLAYALSP